MPFDKKFDQDSRSSKQEHTRYATSQPSKQPLETFVHLIAGGAGGTAGAIITCPLEVVKTRLQSSNSGFNRPSSSVPPSGSSAGGSSRLSNGSNSAQRLSRFVVVPPEFATDKRVATTVPYSLRVKMNSAASRSCSSVFEYLLSSSSRLSNLVSKPNGTELALRFHHSYSAQNAPHRPPPQSMNVLQCLKFIVETEGTRGLFKGLGPNLVGVAPSRAIYFYTYSTAKRNVNESLPVQNRDTPFVHVISAATAGFSASTCTNPIWLVKTRLQLDRASGNKTLSVRKCIQNIHRELGIFGFWRGVTASYWGISETIIHFVIYESLRKQVTEYQQKNPGDDKTFVDFFGFMLCGACSKTIATIVAYPHEVARTRLREEGTKYRSFWQTLGVVAREEGRKGLYRGLVTQLIRQIPNTAIMMATYELTVYGLTKALHNQQQNDDM